MADVLAFWATAMVVAALGYPLAAVLLRRLPDAGAGLTFPLGLVLSSYGYFMLRVLDALPPGRGGYLAALALLAVVAAAVAGRDRWSLVTWRRAWPGLVVAGGVFTFAFFGYVAFRSYNAEIGGTEQPMDLMYLNATLNSEEYPPRDPWLAGESASYYYFGYLQSGVLTAVSGVPASSGYNLSLAYNFAAAASAAGSLGFALARWMLGARRGGWALGAGALAVTLLLFVGSLAGPFEWAAAHGHANRDFYQAFGAEEIASCSVPKVNDYCYSAGTVERTTAWYPTEFWFWFRDTRIIPNTITEFPFFSFLLGDLHPHVTSIPLVLLVLALSAATWRGRSRLWLSTHRNQPFQGLALAVILGALAFQNAWDVLTFALVFTLGVFARNFRRTRPVDATIDTLGFIAGIGVAAAVLYSPWILTFSSQAQGIEPYIGAGTRPSQALLQFGPIVVAGLLAAASAVRGLNRDRALNLALGAAWIPVTPFIAWVLFVFAKGDLSKAVDARLASGWTMLILYGAAVWLLSFGAVALASKRRAAALPATLAAVGVLLLYGSELFLVKDVFFGGAPRLNTIFKLSYQAWMLLSIAGGAAVVVALSHWRSRPALAAVAIPASLLVALGLVYPLIAAFNRTDGFNLETNIDGAAALRSADPGEYELARWFETETPLDAVVIEASGRRWAPGAGGPTVIDGGSDYSDSARISARSGRATPIGWYFHEIQWRGENPRNLAEFSRRQELVDSAYISGDPETVIDVMREFGADYLVVGRIELSRYPGLMPDFSKFLDVAFVTGNYTVYRLPEREVVHTS